MSIIWQIYCHWVQPLHLIGRCGHGGMTRVLTQHSIIVLRCWPCLLTYCFIIQSAGFLFSAVPVYVSRGPHFKHKSNMSIMLFPLRVIAFCRHIKHLRQNNSIMWLYDGPFKPQRHAKFEVAGFYWNIRKFVFRRQIRFLSHPLGEIGVTYGFHV